MSKNPLMQVSDEVLDASPSFALLLAMSMKKLATPEQSLKLLQDLMKLCRDHKSFAMAFGFSIYMFFMAVSELEDDLTLRTAALEGIKAIDMHLDREKIERFNRSMRD